MIELPDLNTVEDACRKVFKTAQRAPAFIIQYQSENRIAHIHDPKIVVAVIRHEIDGTTTRNFTITNDATLEEFVSNAAEFLKGYNK